MKYIQINDRIVLRLYREYINRFGNNYILFHFDFLDKFYLDSNIVYILSSFILSIDDLSKLIESVYNIIEFNGKRDCIYFNNTNNITMNSNGMDIERISEEIDIINIVEYNPITDIYFFKLNIVLDTNLYDYNLNNFIIDIASEFISDIPGYEYLVPDFLL